MSNVQLFKLVALNDVIVQPSPSSLTRPPPNNKSSTKIEIEFIINMLPRENKCKAREICKLLKNDFYINEKGEAVIHDNTLLDSNVHSLLLYITNKRNVCKTVPNGLNEFVLLLQEKCIPKHLMNCKVRKMLKKRKCNL